MDNASRDTSPNLVVQFRVRTLLILTAVLAVLAAIIGPYYRSVEPVGQHNLLAFWSMLLLWTGTSFWLQLRSAFRLASDKETKFLVYAGHRTTWMGRARRLIILFTFSTLLFYVVFNSWLAGTGVIRPTEVQYTNPLLQGFVLGGWAASLIFALVRKPLALRGDGIPVSGRQLIPWRYIRGVEWLPKRPNTMKLSRYDGDIYIEVTPAIRDDVEAFIRQKIGAVAVAAATI